MSDQEHRGSLARYHAQQIRSDLARARQELCPCGVRPEHCADHKPTETEGAK